MTGVLPPVAFVAGRNVPGPLPPLLSRYPAFNLTLISYFMMRIQFFVSSRLAADSLPACFSRLLSSSLLSLGGVEVLDGPSPLTPHLVHVLGSWDRGLSASLFRAVRRHLPVVYSPLGGLLPWTVADQRLDRRLSLWRDERLMIRQAGAVHVTSQAEQSAVLRAARPREVRLIRNAVSTATLSPEEMAREMVCLYREVILSCDRRQRESISKSFADLADQPVIRRLFSSLLYVRYQLSQGSIPGLALDSLSRRLTQASFDEDLAADLLTERGLLPFARRLCWVMSQTSGLTEGFMPVPPLMDRQAKKMIEKVDKNLARVEDLDKGDEKGEM